jgi:AraC family transcriptional regulator
MVGAVMDERYSLGRVSPPAEEHRRFAWDGGAFDTARRSYTASVEGTLRSPSHLVMATLAGGAARHEFVTDCGYRYDGPDKPGTVSFLPANCERRLKLQGVAWQWASIALSPELLDEGGENATPGAFSDVKDRFLFGALSEMQRLHALDGGLDLTYCDAMSVALAHYIKRRYVGRAEPGERVPARLSPWRLRRIADYVDAHLEGGIRINALATLVGLSEGHLHRTFRATTGETPLQFVNRKRVQRAMELLAGEPVTVVELALRLGFQSPSHLARIFRGVTGVTPSQYRQGLE